MAISYGTYTITDVQEGSQIWTSSVAPSSPNYTFTISNLTGDSETSIKVGDIIMYSYYRYTVLSISNDGTTVLTGNRVSIRGATGAASVTYSLIVSNLAIIKDKDGNLSPSSITVTAKSQTGSNAMANYTGRIKIETTTNNSTWTSRINEDASTKTYTIPTDTVAIRCSLYLNGGTTTLLDQQTIPVVSDGLDGTNVTITSTSITYQEGTSGTIKPTGTWKTNVQSVAQGNFLWTKTVVNYSDGSSTESYSVARQGSNGINGTSPTVSNTVVEYQQSTNGKTVPTGTWNTTPPTAIAEQFMWTRTTITYSDSATAISYSVSRNGTNGTSISISSTSVTYQKGTSGTVKPTGTWETNVQPVGEGEYLWTKTVVTYSDSSKTESYSVSRNAVNGTNGTSPTVTSTVTEYVQSNNGTTTPTSGWNTSPPSTVTAGWFMWTKVTVTYSDNATSTSYTVSKNGTNGNNGINTATVYLYKKGTTAPSVPSGNTTYTFSTKTLTGTLDSWNQAIPTTGNGECYVTAAVASSSGTTDTIATGEWSTPIQFNGTNGTNGTDGTNGLNQATIFLYKRGASVTKPTTSVTYTFSTGTLSAEPNSWKRNIPTIDGNPCWVVTATAIGNGTTATITGSNWSDPVKLVEDGEDGKDAYTIVLTNENHTFAGNSVSAIASEMECNVIAYKGATQIAATIGTITGQPTGMTTSLSNNGTTNASFTVAVTTNMVTKNGVLTIPITVDNKTFTKKFTYSLALKGISGTSENLLMDVYASSLTKVDAPSSRYLSDASNSTITGEFIAEANLPDPNATHFYRITDSSATTKGRGLCFYSSGTPPFITGHTYRIGCWVRKHSGSPKIQITLGSYGSWMPTQRKIENTEWEWVEVVRTFGETDASKTTQSDTYKRLYFYFYNNNVADSSLDMCGFRMEELQTNSGTARNLLLGTEKLTNWGVENGATIFDGIATFPTVTANSWREIYPANNFKYELIRNQYAIFSIKVKGNIDEKCCINLCIGVDTTNTAYARKKYFNQFVYFVGTGEWQTICSALPIFDYMFTTGSGTVDFNNCWMTVRIGAVNSYWNGFQAKEPQLSLGATATSWTPAPEDIEEEVSSLRTDLQSQIDEKIQTYYQATAPSWSNATDRAKHDGDLWYCTETDLYTGYEAKNVYRYNSTNNTWVNYSTTSELFDAVDGKSTIYYGTTTDTFEDVEDGDYLVDSTTGSTYRYYNDAWVTVTDYQTAIDNIEIGGRNLLKGSDVANTQLTGSKIGGTVTQTIPSGTVITLSVQVDADDVVWGSSGNKRIGVASSIPKDSSGTQYIEAWAAMTGRTGIGIDKTFDTSFHGRVKSTYTLQGELPLDKAFNLYIQSVTSGTVSVSRPKLEIGNKATDWTPAPEDIEEEIASKADSSVAVEEEQLIYISKASGTNTVTGTTTWVTGTGDVQNTWTTKRPTYNSSYPVLFIAKQKKTVSGTVTCTTPLKDDTTTVIDGGHITTGTIDASQVTVTNIDASKITTGKLNANVIEANSLSISQISGLQTSLNGKQPTGDYATNNDVTTAINNIEIGGRNLIINTLNPSTISANRPKIIGQTVNTIGRGTASVAEHGIRFTTTSASYCYIYMGFTALTTGEGATLQGLTVGETYTFSCDFTCKIFSADTSTTTRYLRFYVYDDTSGSFASDKYQNMIDLDTSKKGTEQSGHFYYTFTLPTNITKFGFMVRTNVTTSGLFTTGEFIELRNIKLEKGSKATDWSPASEDINTEVNNAEENAEKVATNYLAFDNTGIMVADMKNGQQTPSTISSGRNVFIDDNSVNIRNGQDTLASFTGDNTKFYDITSVSNREVASFGANGVRVGNEDEQHFIVDSESIQAINENGSPIFSVTSTGGTITSGVVVAREFNSQGYNYDIVLNGGIGSSENTFYPKYLFVLINIKNSRNEFTSFEVSINNGEFEDVPFTRTSYTPENSGLVVYSRHRVDLPPFLFHYGTSERISYQLEGVYTSDKGNTYRYSGDFHISYNGQRTITMEPYQDYFLKKSGDAEDDTDKTNLNGYLWGDIYSSLGYTKAPAMTFGTRGSAGTIAPLSVTIGQDLYANNENQLSIGKYNLNNDELFPLAFAIGNGTDDANRSNAFNVDWDGNTEISGDLEVAQSLIVDGSNDNIPNVTINKSSTNTADFINCQDANLNSKFRVLNDGGIRINNKTMLGVKTFYWDTGTIEYNRGWSRSKHIGVDGYYALGIIGFGCFSQKTNPASSTPKNVDWCVVTKCFVWSGSDPILNIYVWNQHPQQSAACGVYVKVLYVSAGTYQWFEEESEI